MKPENLIQMFNLRLKTVHNFTHTKIGRRFLIISVAVFVLMFIAPLFHATVGATLLACVGAPMTILVWRKYDSKHAIVPAVFFCIPMILDMILYLSITVATCMLVGAVSTLIVATHPAFSYIRKIDDDMYSYLYAGAVCVVIVVLSSLLTLLVSVAWWLFCLVLFVAIIGVFFSVVLSTAAYTATDAKRQARKKELREYDLEETQYDFDIFAKDLGIKRDRDKETKVEVTSRKRRHKEDNNIFYDVD